MQRLESALSSALKVIAATMVAAILAITLGQVVLRYAFNIALPWSADTAQVLLVYTVMLVGGYGVGKGSHFALMMLVDASPERFRGAFRLLHSVLILAFAVIVLVYGTRLSLSQMSTKLPALGIPVGFVYMALPIGAALMIFFAASNLFKSAGAASSAAKTEV